MGHGHPRRGLTAVLLLRQIDVGRLTASRRSLTASIRFTTCSVVRGRARRLCRASLIGCGLTPEEAEFSSSTLIHPTSIAGCPPPGRDPERRRTMSDTRCPSRRRVVEFWPLLPFVGTTTLAMERHALAMLRAAPRVRRGAAPRFAREHRAIERPGLRTDVPGTVWYGASGQYQASSGPGQVITGVPMIAGLVAPFTLCRRPSLDVVADRPPWTRRR
jgi:hypothetical protein